MKPALILSCLISLPALATTKPSPKPDEQAVASAEAKAAAVSNSIAAAKADSKSDANANNTNTVTTSPTSTSGSSLSVEYEANASTAYAPDVYPTAPCTKGWSVGGSAPGAGISFGRSGEVEGCVKRELIRMAAQMGMADHARYLWCNQPEAVEVFGTVEMCMGFGSKITEPVTIESESIEQCADERQQLVAAQERFDRAVEACRSDK